MALEQRPQPPGNTWRVYGRFLLADHLRVIVEIGCRKEEPIGPTTEDPIGARLDHAQALTSLMKRLRALAYRTGALHK